MLLVAGQVSPALCRTASGVLADGRRLRAGPTSLRGSPHAGDWAFSVRRLSPAPPPPHFPPGSRHASPIAWEYDSALRIDGDAYFALDPPAPGRLNAELDTGRLRAPTSVPTPTFSCTFGPWPFAGSVGVGVYVRATFCAGWQGRQRRRQRSTGAGRRRRRAP
jgi:hypothetical protein